MKGQKNYKTKLTNLGTLQAWFDLRGNRCGLRMGRRPAPVVESLSSIVAECCTGAAPHCRVLMLHLS